MNFNSWQFLLFLPVVVLLYYLLPHKARWAMLLVASYVFYMSWNAWLIILILVTTVTAYVAGIIIGRTQSAKAKKACLIITLVICLGMLVFFKYINFLLEAAVGIIRLFDAERDGIMLNVILPVGISFYTFQTLSYVIDVYRGDFQAEKHFGYFALYVAYFPQLVAGPIERPQTLLPQLREEHKLDGDNMLAGAKYLLSGFFRKCVISDFCGIFVNNVYGDLSNADGLAVFVASALFLMQIYNDFAGYSEIAMGAARMMGVKLTENFDRPFVSTSTTEFFRRWHITLNQWFTQYVYIPLGGNRKGRVRKIINTLIVFALCGLWHGANWTFMLWGLCAGFFVCVESLLKKPLAKLCEKLKINAEDKSVRLVKQIFMFVLFSLSAVLFRSQSVAEIGIAFGRMFTAWNGLSAALSDLGMNALQIVQLTVFFVVMALISRFPRQNKAASSMSGSDIAVEISVFVFGIAAVALCWPGLLAMGDASAFQYFRF